MARGPRVDPMNQTTDQFAAKRPGTVRRGRLCAFTLIELLLVISIIALLVGILLPALSGARKQAQNLREVNAIRQLGTAYSTYALEAKDRLMPGYLRSSWATRGRDPAHEFLVWDSPEGGNEYNRLTGAVIRKYPWRIAPYLGFSLEALIVDRNLYREYRALPSSPNDYYGYQWSFASNPSFGLNTTYVGGDAHRGAFYLPALLRYGPYYITRTDQPIFTDKLVIFASARGAKALDGTQMVPGNHRIEGPWNANSVTNAVPVFTRWRARPGERFDPSHSDNHYGHLDLRLSGRAATVMFDGHAALLNLDELSDMRRWSNQATDPDWHPR